MSATKRILMSFDSRDGLLGSPPEQARFQLSRPLHHVRAISLKAFEWPILLPNIRSPSCNVLIIGTDTFTLTPKNYTKIADLITDLNTLTEDLSLVWNVTTGGHVWFQGPAEMVSSSVGDTPFGRMMLGFNAQPTIMGVAIAAKPYNLSLDNVWFMDLDRLPVNDTLNASGKPGVFRIQSTGVYQSIILQNDGIGNTQRVELSTSDFTWSDLTVRLYDRFGNPCTQCADWTCLFEAEVGP